MSYIPGSKLMKVYIPGSKIMKVLYSRIKTYECPIFQDQKLWMSYIPGSKLMMVLYSRIKTYEGPIFQDQKFSSLSANDGIKLSWLLATNSTLFYLRYNFATSWWTLFILSSFNFDIADFFDLRYLTSGCKERLEN